MIQDLSDRKHVEEALRESERRLAQAQKMEAVGQLTGDGEILLWIRLADADDVRRAYQCVFANSSNAVGVNDLSAPPSAH
jgi:hypothetical protein